MNKNNQIIDIYTVNNYSIDCPSKLDITFNVFNANKFWHRRLNLKYRGNLSNQNCFIFGAMWLMQWWWLWKYQLVSVKKVQSKTYEPGCLVKSVITKIGN